MNLRGTVAQHPGFRWACGAVEFIVVDALMFLGITPAWAAFSIPLTDKITINLGELPQWIVALVAAGGFLKAWQAERSSKLNAATLTSVSKQIDGLLADRDKGNVAKGEAKGEAAGERVAEALKEGQRQGAETERASVAAANPSAAVSPGASPGSPVPVADGRVGDAVELMADATGKVADATKELTEAKK